MHRLAGGSLGSDEAAHSIVPTRLNIAAAKAGFMAGSAVKALGSFQSKAREIPSRMQLMNERLMSAASGVKGQGGHFLSDWKNIGRLSLNQGRQKAKQAARNKPLQLLAGVAALAFSLGLGLRLWRSTRVDSR